MGKRCYGCMRIKGSAPRCQFCGWLETDQNGHRQLPVGTVLHDQYELGRVLGQGGFGITYLGWDTSLEIPVAIKEYYPRSLVERNQGTTVVATDNPQFFQAGKERFLQEARTLARLQNLPNIVRVRTFFKENNTTYIVMELIEGVTLKEYVRQKGGALSVEEAFAIMEPVLRTMAQVHQTGMIHRDISPDNIMVKTDGTVKILDFGTARDVDLEAGQLTHSTTAVMKRGYTPVEQLDGGRDIDQRADEYALCGTLYFCLSGQTPPDIFARVRGKALGWENIPGLTPAQIAALEKGGAIQVEDRFPDLGGLIQVLYPQGALPAPKPPALVKPPEPPKEAEDLTTPAAPLPKMAVPENVRGGETELVEESRKPAAGKKKWRIGKKTAAALLAMAILPAVTMLGVRNAQYNGALNAMNTGDFDGAYQTFSELGDYRNSQEMLPEVRYQEAMYLMDSKDYPSAYALVVELGDYKDSQKLLPEVRYQAAKHLMNDKDYRNAYAMFSESGDYKDSQKYKTAVLRELFTPESNTLSAGDYHTVGLNADGTAAAVGMNEDDECNVSSWQDLTAISAGWRYTVGLKQNGTVVATGLNYSSQRNISDWKDIIAVSAAGSHIVGLKADGTVEAKGLNYSGQCNVSGWTDIVAVSAGGCHTLGLKVDGTVVAVGWDDSGRCNVSAWKDIIAISAGEEHTVGLKADGTVVAVGVNNYGQCNVSDWKDIIAVSAGGSHTVGLKADGTVVAAGNKKHGRCNVSRWKDIVAVSAGGSHTAGLKADGTVVTAGYNEHGQCDVSDWKNIRLPGSW